MVKLREKGDGRNEAGEFQRYGIQLLEKENEAGGISGDYGRDHPMRGVGGVDHPYYLTGKRGRPPIEIETMLRMYLLQCWFHLSDEGVEDAIYDS